MAVKNRQSKANKKRELKLPTNTTRVVKVVGVVSIIVVSFLLLVSFPKVLNGVFSIEKVVFIGENERLNQSELIEKLKLKERAGMLLIDLQELRLEFLNDSWIKRAQIRKQWPNTLVVTLTENKPVAMIDKSYLMADGEIIDGSSSEEPDRSLLKIEHKEVTKKTKNEMMRLSEKLRTIQQTLQANSFKLQRVIIDETGSWSFETGQGLLVKMGRKKQLERVERFLQVYVAIGNKDRISSVDLRYGNGLAVELLPLVDDAEIKG